jgi:hypothetical protein
MACSNTTSGFADGSISSLGRDLIDRGRFDALARLVSAKQSRRGALAALLGAAFVGHDRAAVAKPRGRGRVKGQAKAKSTTAAAPCYPAGTGCVPGKGKNNSGCDFSHSSVFVNRDARGSNLSNANFSGADVWGADFRGANLSGACFVDATLFRAKLGASVNLGGAVFCRTLMPDGSVDNSGCDLATACCPTSPPPPSGSCQGLFHLCGFPGPCCDGLTCAPLITAPFITACEKECKSDEDCRPYSASLACRFDAIVCPSIGVKCCVPR